MPAFEQVAADPHAHLDELAVALAQELREVDPAAVYARLDQLAADVREAVAAAAPQQAPLHAAADTAGAQELDALTEVLGGRHGFAGAREHYDHPDHSMIDLVLERGRGLPIVLSVVYVEAARRAGIALDAVGLPGHFVVGRVAPGAPPILLDPFSGGARIPVPDGCDPQPWSPRETALRMLNNLVGSYTRRNDLGRAIRVAELRLALPLAPELATAMTAELRGLRARLN